MLNSGQLAVIITKKNLVENHKNFYKIDMFFSSFL